MESTSKLSNIFKTIDDHFARFAFNHNVFIVRDTPLVRIFLNQGIFQKMKIKYEVSQYEVYTCRTVYY